MSEGKKTDGEGARVISLSARRADVERARAIQENRLAAAPVLKELASHGLIASSISELVRMYAGRAPYETAIPILLRWLPEIRNGNIREGIVRSLSVPQARPVAAPALIRQFKSLFEEFGPSAAWAAGNGLSIVADDSVREEIIALATERRYGRAREMLLHALGNMKREAVIPVLLELIDDPDVEGHAIKPLRKLNALEARSAIERRLAHPKTWIRNEAKKTLAKLDKVEAKTRR